VEHLVDTARGREMGLLVLYPLTTATGDPVARFPLILFNHGFMLWGDLYRSYGDQLASHGFVVALPSYPMSFSSANHTALAGDARFVIDHCLALDAQPEGALSDLIDETRIGASGHSFGGKLSLLVASMDSRIRAVGVLDPVDGGGPAPDDPILFPSVAPERMADIRVPLFFIGAELGGVSWFLIPCAPVAENYQRFYEAANSPAIEITQRGAAHGQYVDSGAEAMLAACAPGTADTEWVRSSSAAYLTAFFLGRLREDTAALAWLDARLAADEAEGRIVVRRK
jgi:pimeloyl-ACP methyl ester carboxylesterase